MKIRKVLAGILTCALSVSLLAGCASGKQANKEEKTQEQTGSVQLSMWVHETDSPEGKFYKKRIQEFNEANKGKIKVDLLAIPRGGGGSGYEDRINAALTTGELPDIITVDGPNVAAYAESGVIAPIDEYINKDSLKDFVPSIIQQGTYKDKLYHLGAMESSVVLYYNKKMFKEAGIEAPTKVEDAWTWDELYANAKKLTKNGVYGLDMHMDYGVGEWLTYGFLPFVWSNGGEIIAPNGSTSDGYLNGPKTVEALNFVGKLFKEKIVNVSPKATDFEEGKAAMVLCGPWVASGIEQNYPDLEWGMMPYPVSPNTKKQFTPSGSWGFSMTSNSKNQKAAAQVIEFMTNTDSCVAMNEANGMPPARKSAFEKISKYKELPYKIIADQLNTSAYARPRTPAYPVLSQKFAEAFNAVALGQDAQKATNDAVKYVDREIKKFK